MATINATVTGVTLLGGSNSMDEAGVRHLAYLLSLSFGQYTASADSAALTGVQDRIEEFVKNGKALTTRAAIGHLPGRSTAGAMVYTSPTITNSSGTLTFDLCSSATGLEADCAASQGVQIIVTVSE